MNKLIATLTVFTLIFNLPIISSASNTNVTNINPSYESTDIIDLGDGFTIEYEITESIPMTRANAKTATKTATYRFDGNVIATIKLTASFSYTGSSATCTSASSTYSMAKGWSYSNRTTSRSGNTATTSAKLIKGLNYANISTTLKCSNTGVIS